MKLGNKFEYNRTIHGEVIAILMFDLMTSNIALRVALGSGIIFTKFDLRQRIGAWIIAFFIKGFQGDKFKDQGQGHAVTLTLIFELWTI